MTGGSCIYMDVAVYALMRMHMPGCSCMFMEVAVCGWK